MFKKPKDILLNITIHHTVWILVIVVSLIAIIFIPRFGSGTNLLNIIIHMIPLGLTIFAMGLCLMSGFFDLSLESTYAIAPIFAILVATKWAPNFPGIAFIAIIITIVVGMFIGLINGILSIKIGINPFLVTLCMMLILRGLSLFLIPAGIFNLPEAYIFLGNARILGNALPINVLFFILVTVILYWIMSKKPFGRHLLAVGSNERAAFLAGIKVDRLKISVFMIAGALAAMGGLVAAGRQHAVLNSMGQGTMVLMFAGAVLGGISLKGGIGSISGVLGGILLLQIISNLITLAKINPFLIQVMYGSVLLVALLLQSLRVKLRQFIKD